MPSGGRSGSRSYSRSNNKTTSHTTNNTPSVTQKSQTTSQTNNTTSVTPKSETTNNTPLVATDTGQSSGLFSNIIGTTFGVVSGNILTNAILGNRNGDKHEMGNNYSDKHEMGNNKCHDYSEMVKECLRDNPDTATCSIAINKYSECLHQHDL